MTLRVDVDRHFKASSAALSSPIRTEYVEESMSTVGGERIADRMLTLRPAKHCRRAADDDAPIIEAPRLIMPRYRSIDDDIAVIRRSSACR